MPWPSWLGPVGCSSPRLPCSSVCRGFEPHPRSKKQLNRRHPGDLLGAVCRVWLRFLAGVVDADALAQLAGAGGMFVTTAALFISMSWVRAPPSEQEAVEPTASRRPLGCRLSRLA